MTRVLCAGPQPWGLLFSAMMSLDSEPRLLSLLTTLYTDSLPILTVEGHQEGPSHIPERMAQPMGTSWFSEHDG